MCVVVSLSSIERVRKRRLLLLSLQFTHACRSLVQFDRFAAQRGGVQARGREGGWISFTVLRLIRGAAVGDNAVTDSTMASAMPKVPHSGGESDEGNNRAEGERRGPAVGSSLSGSIYERSAGEISCEEHRGKRKRFNG